jgi:hypothetical protein
MVKIDKVVNVTIVNHDEINKALDAEMVRRAGDAARMLREVADQLDSNPGMFKWLDVLRQPGERSIVLICKD